MTATEKPGETGHEKFMKPIIFFIIDEDLCFACDQKVEISVLVSLNNILGLKGCGISQKCFKNP